MQTNGSDVLRLTSHSAVDSDPAYSPDGSRIVFFSNRDGHWEMYTMSSLGTDQTEILDDTFEDYRASFLDDHTLIFQTNRWGGSQIASIDLTSGTITQLTTQGGERAAVWCPAPSPDPTPTPLASGALSLTVVFPTPIIPTPSAILTTVHNVDTMQLFGQIQKQLVSFTTNDPTGTLFLAIIGVLSVFGVLGPWAVGFFKNR
jgi:hypothetical protein